MKTIFYTAIAVLLASVINIQAQSVTFVRTSAEYVYHSPGPFVDIESDATVTNTTNHNINLVFKRVLNNLPNSNWSTAFCFTLCYPPTVDSSYEQAVSPGQHTFSFHFYPDSVVPGIGHAKMLCYNADIRSDSASVTFNGSTFPVGIRQISSTVNGFKLNQNYPNPFNPTTRIGFSVDKSNYVDLRLYDILGREVKVLLSQPMNPGEYEIDFKADNLASGMYYYRLQSGENVAVKKMTLVK
ncbi:MAG: T9SS type A sorting domain-containing protein [Ignavibacteria bacterium]|jgi:hypothetical protein